MSLYTTLETFLLVISGFLMIWGNIMGIGNPEAGLPWLIIGSILGIIAFLLSLLITATNEGQDVNDIIFINSLIYPLLVGIVLSIGSLFDPNPKASAEAQMLSKNIQSIFLDLGLIMGLFIIFVYIWQTIKARWDFLTLEDIDFTSSADKDAMPQFLLVCLILGALLGGLFIGFKFLFVFVGYNITSYSFMILVFAVCITLSFILRAVKKG
ncbi:MAG: hypothetical protein ACTSQP_10745 [Promethearchaeota archaeon]